MGHQYVLQKGDICGLSSVIRYPDVHQNGSLAVFEERVTESGIIKIENLRIHFPPVTPRHLSDKSLSRTYRTKPLVVVVVNDEFLFGELAILRYLQSSGDSN
jgi:hypothetical protein